MNRCLRCRRTMKNKKSIEHGMGSVCWRKYQREREAMARLQLQLPLEDRNAI